MKGTDEVLATQKLLNTIRGEGQEGSTQAARESAARGTDQPVGTASGEGFFLTRSRRSRFLMSGQVRVGLDIGHRNIKMVRLERRGRRYRLLQLGIAEVAPEGESPEALLEAQFVATKSILRDAISRRQPVVTCLCDPGIIIRQITLPNMTQRDLERAIPFEARKHFPYDHSRVMFNYQVVNEGPRTQICEVLLVAVPHEPLKRHEDLLKRLGVEPYAIETGPLALANAYLLAQRKSRETIVLLDLGASGTLIDIHRAEGTLFYRRLPISGGRLTREIMKGLDVPLEVAERLKHGERLNGEPELSQVQEALLPAIELLLMEIRRSLAYYDNVTGRLGFSRLFLTGGGALLPGLKEFLEEKLELPVEVMDPLEAVDWDDAHFARGWMERTRPLWALAVALATRP